MVRKVVFHKAGSRARMLLRLGAIARAAANAEVVESDDNLNLISTVSKERQFGMALDNWEIMNLGFSWLR